MTLNHSKFNVEPMEVKGLIDKYVNRHMPVILGCTGYLFFLPEIGAQRNI